MLSRFFHFDMFLRNKISGFQTYATVPILFLFYATNPATCGKITLGTEADAGHLSLGDWRESGWATQPPRRGPLEQLYGAKTRLKGQKK